MGGEVRYEEENSSDCAASWPTMLQLEHMENCKAVNCELTCKGSKHELPCEVAKCEPTLSSGELRAACKNAMPANCELMAWCMQAVARCMANMSSSLVS